MSSVRLFKLAYYSELHRRPLLVPKQAAVIGDFVGLGWEEAARKVTEIFLDALDDEAVEQARPLLPYYAPSPKKQHTAPGLLYPASSLLAYRFSLYLAASIALCLAKHPISGVCTPFVTVEFALQLGELKVTRMHLGCKREVSRTAKLTSQELEGTSVTVLMDGADRLRSLEFDLPHAPPKRRRMEDIERVEMACTVCGVVPPPSTAMVAMQCNHAFCEPCLSSRLGCACDCPPGQRWLKTCGCNCACPVCDAKLRWVNITAVREPSSTPENSPWQFLKRVKKCECARAVQPTFGLPGQKKDQARWCQFCPDKPQEAVDLTFKYCECGRGLCMMGLPGEERKAGVPRASGPVFPSKVFHPAP